MVVGVTPVVVVGVAAVGGTDSRRRRHTNLDRARSLSWAIFFCRDDGVVGVGVVAVADGDLILVVEGVMVLE